MNTMTIQANRIGRVFRALVMMTWVPVPFFGAALAAMLLFWLTLALQR